MRRRKRTHHIQLPWMIRYIDLPENALGTNNKPGRYILLDDLKHIATDRNSETLWMVIAAVQESVTDAEANLYSQADF